MLKIIEKYLGISIVIVCISFWFTFFTLGISAINGNTISQITIFTITIILIISMILICNNTYCCTSETYNDFEK